MGRMAAAGSTGAPSGTPAPSTEQAWADLHRSIHGFVRRRVRQPADADDLVQQIFLQLHRSLPALRQADGLQAWLYQTARRAIADYYRAPAHRREVPSGAAIDFAPDQAGPEGGEDASSFAELARCLDPLLASLAETDREALRLVEFDGITQTEAARRLGLSVSGMKSRVQRARARLRAVVDDCCRVELDRRGGVVAYTPRRNCACGVCDPS